MQEIDAARVCWRVGTTLKGERFWAKALRFVEWSVRVMGRLRAQPIAVVNCHSLSSLPLCTILARRHRAKLVYEPHELETETPTFRGARKAIAKRMERALIRFAAKTIVVSGSIAERYQRDYGLDHVPVVRNVPPLRPDGIVPRSRVFRDPFDIPDDATVYLYQGVLERQRGCGLLIEAFRRAGGNSHLVFLGFGPMEQEIRDAAATYPNIHFHPAVPPESVLEYTAGADAGFALLDDTCDNHRCALPNKLFHYLHAGLPVLVSDLEEMGRLVDRYECGWRVGNTAESIARTVDSLTPERIVRAVAGAKRCRAEMNWQSEERVLVEVYEDVLGASGVAEPLAGEAAPAGDPPSTTVG